MKSTVHHFALAGLLSLGLAATAAVAQDRPAPPGGPQAGAHGPGRAGPDREKLFAQMKQQREQRLHDLLQIKPDQEAPFHAFLTSMEQARPQRGRRPDGAKGPEGRGPDAHLTTPERLDRMNQRMAERTAERQQRLQKTTVAVKTFYAVLTPEQRKAFDELPLLRIGDHPGPGGPGRWGGHMGHRFEG